MTGKKLATVSTAAAEQPNQRVVQVKQTDAPDKPNATPQIIINIPSGAKENDAAEILNGVAAILWPIVLALIVLMFRNQIISLSQRLRKGSAFGAEAEFEAELGALNREASKAKEEVNIPNDPDTRNLSGSALAGEQEQSVDTHAGGDKTDEVRDRVLSETTRSSRLGLMLLSSEIERMAGQIAASTGHIERSTLRAQLDTWGSQLPPHTSAAYRLFSHVRNRIVHGRDASEAEILSAIDSGLSLFDALAAIPIERNIVAYPGVDIFSDQNATQRLEGKGLLIETTHNGEKTFRIFPTTKTHYIRGMRLTWEWNMGHVWSNAWYRDPETGELKEAWTSSAEFVGRDLDKF